MIYDNNKDGKYGEYFVQELKEPPNNGTPEFREMYSKFSKRILWMDGDVRPDAFQMNTAWYFAVPSRDPVFEEHVHDTAELIGFYGSNPDDPYDLGGEVHFAIDGEEHKLTRSTMIYLPGGLSHGPVRVLEVKRPIFHFSIVTSTKYEGQIYK